MVFLPICPSPPQAHTLFCPFSLFFHVSFPLGFAVETTEARNLTTAVAVCVAPEHVPVLEGECHSSSLAVTRQSWTAWFCASSFPFCPDIFQTNIYVDCHVATVSSLDF